MAYVAPGSVILVTGATGAIGFEISAQAAEAGAVVAVHGSRAESVAGAIERLKARAPEAKLIGVPGDFRQPGVVEAVVAKAAAEGGRLDALVHCAITGAPGVTGPFRKTTPESFGKVAELVLGTFQRLCFAAMPHLAEQGGAIVGFAADAGRFAAARQSIMGSVYGGIMTFVRNLAVEAGRDKVRVHCISPSFVVDTPIFDAFAGVGDRGIRAQERAPLGLPSPKDIAPVALFLCGPDSAKITGQIISVNGGLNA
jgi:3-oxoacyl-[acyl-carrier protein] reductase